MPQVRLPKWQSPRPRGGPNHPKSGTAPYRPDRRPGLTRPIGAVTDCFWGRRRIPTVPVGYTIVYNRGWPKPPGGCKKVSSSDQKRSKVIKNDQIQCCPSYQTTPKTALALSPSGFSGLHGTKGARFCPPVYTIVYSNLFALKAINPAVAKL